MIIKLNKDTIVFKSISEGDTVPNNNAKIARPPVTKNILSAIIFLKKIICRLPFHTVLGISKF